VIASRVQSVGGPLSSIAATFVDAETVAPGAHDPAVFLGRRMDLRGSVALAQQLEDCDAPGAATAPGTRTQLSVLIDDRVGAIRELVVRTFADPFQRRNKLRTPEQMAAILNEPALFDSRPRSLAAAADAVWAPCGDLLGRTLDQVRFELGALREDIGPPLAGLGVATARLERLDGALFGATAKGRAELEDRLLSAVARSFASRFVVAVGALPAAVTAADLHGWFEIGGLLRAAVDRGRDAILGILAHDARRLAALVASS